MFKKYQGGGPTEPYVNPLEQISQSYGLDFQTLLGMGPQGLATYFGQRYGISDPDLMKGELYQLPSQQELQSLMQSSYDPLLQAQQPTMLNQLLTGADKFKTGGFGASYMPQRQMAGLYDVYGKNIQGVLGDIAGKRSDVESSIAERLLGYGQTSAELRG